MIFLHFYLPLPHPSPGAVMVSVLSGNQVLSSPPQTGERAPDLICKLSRMFCSDLKDGLPVSSSRNSEHKQGTRRTWLIHTTRGLQTNSRLEQGISGNIKQTIYRLQKKPGRYSGKLGHSEAAMCKDFRKPHAHPSKMHVGKFLRRPGALPQG